MTIILSATTAALHRHCFGVFGRTSNPVCAVAFCFFGFGISVNEFGGAPGLKDPLENAAAMANHASPAPRELYDRRRDEVGVAARFVQNCTLTRVSGQFRPRADSLARRQQVCSATRLHPASGAKLVHNP
jgi:hypothetical protein